MAVTVRLQCFGCGVRQEHTCEGKPSVMVCAKCGTKRQVVPRPALEKSETATLAPPGRTDYRHEPLPGEVHYA